MALIIVATLASVIWSLWIRRATWRCRWEFAATLNVALQGGAVALMTPLGHDYFHRHISSLADAENLSQYVAHDCYIVAASAIVYNTIGRLDDAHRFQWAFRQYVERPATVCIPLMLAAFTLGNGAKIYNPDFFNVPCDTWLTLYWIIFCGVTIYLLAYGARALRILMDNPQSRTIAAVYLGACFFGIAGCLVRIYACFDYPWELQYGDGLTWFNACACGAVFAIASGWSWIEKTRWFTERRLEAV